MKTYSLKWFREKNTHACTHMQEGGEREREREEKKREKENEADVIKC